MLNSFLFEWKKKAPAPVFSQTEAGVWISIPFFLRQHRTIWQEAPAWIFGSIQSLENEGILYVFLVFHTELQLKSLKKILIA